MHVLLGRFGLAAFVFLAAVTPTNADTMITITGDGVIFRAIGPILAHRFNAKNVGVSGDGKTVVGTATSSNPGGTPFRWTAETGMVSLGILPGGTIGKAARANADGTVVVGTSTSAFYPDPGIPPSEHAAGEAFRWTTAMGMVGLGVFPGHDRSGPRGVSADGSIVSGYSENTSVVYSGRSFRWSAATGLVDLGVVSGALHSGVDTISADGEVQGGVGGTSANPTGNLPLLWTQADGFIEIGLFEGGTSGYIGELSADGSVAVGAAAAPVEAFRWTAPTGMIGLGFLPGGGESLAHGMSADGNTVVGTSRSATLPDGEAFVWTASAEMQSLPAKLASLGIDLTGWNLQAATGVSADGQVIVGHGSSPDGVSIAWIVGPPPPSFAGNPTYSNCHGKSVAALSQQYGSLSAAADALGFPNVKSLQDAVAAYCSS